ncbi:uncharacterized protein F13E9.13, mitochondrial-like isoform X1 [Apostichopus japonicus]|uniref:uncharacterized protein F13E9.13, mitochondrial-like isoform X1 n=3 Tax=Stichopus japonicus TaxID=307972 RepID=UPI003AB50902
MRRRFLNILEVPSEMDKFISLFRRQRGVIVAMVHIKALPGTPRNSQRMSKIIDVALEEAEMYKNAGVDAIMLENMHDLPYLPPHKIGPEITAGMAAVAYNVKRSLPHLPCGIQVLSAGNNIAIAIAQAAGLEFVRAEGFVFSHVADEGLLNACAGELLRYRKSIQAEDVLIYTDVKKKHSSHAITSDLSVSEVARAAEFFGSDGTIVTGTETGSPVEKRDLEDVLRSVKIPVLVGSGVTSQNVSNFISANALIVGSHFKRDGLWSNEIVPEQVEEFVRTVRSLR